MTGLGVAELWVDSAGFCGLVVLALFGLLGFLLKRTQDSLQESKGTIKYMIEHLVEKGMLDDRAPDKRYEKRRPR